MEAKLLHKKKKLAPNLRFKEFKGDWNLRRLGDLGSFKNGLNKDSSEFGHGSPFVNLMDVFGKTVLMESNFGLVNATEKDLETYNLAKGDVLFIRSSVKRTGVGETILVAKDLTKTVYSGFLIRFRDRNKELDLNFKSYCFSNAPFRKELLSYATSSANTNINQESLAQIKLHFPAFPEQQKIASFLSVVDEKIQQITRKKELLEQYKKGVMQQLFSGKLRFKDENGKAFPKWDEKLLGEIAERNSTKNRSNNVNFVLTNSATQGIVSQDEYFDREIANQNNLEGYYIVAVDDFVYNPRISVHAPVGPIKRNKLKEGVMSPLYSIFRFKEKNLEYFEYYFETKGWHTYLESVSNIGARHDRMNIANSDFFKMPIPFPCLEERKKITDFLNGLSLKIESTNKALIQTQTFKKGLLQQMFV